MDGCVVKPILVDRLHQQIAEVLSGTRKLWRVLALQNRPAPESLDKARLLAQVGNDPALLARMIEMFCEDYPRYVHAIEAALAERDARALKEKAHTLLASSGTFREGCLT